MASPQTSSSHDNMATCNNGEYLAIVSQLMAEKDRLIMEKDELVVSKDRLWREIYQILQEKSEWPGTALHQRTATSHPNRDHPEVQRLREENKGLKRRNQELEQALRDALEIEDDFKEQYIEDERAGPCQLQKHTTKLRSEYPALVA